MFEKVRKYIVEHDMLQQSDCVIVGVSGGADSICLLCVLLKLREEYGLRLIAVHVNHGLRGAEADVDEQYVKTFCEQRGVVAECYKVDVKALAKERGMSAEEAGREARREAFAKAMNKHSGSKIALAHHMNDNVETLFWNIARGTGIRGLGGMYPAKDKYIRPLLCVKRVEIESYLKEEKIAYCTDSTNTEDTYTRNRIRNHLVPYMERELNAKALEHADEMMVQMRKFRDFLEQETAQYYEKCVKPCDGGQLIEAHIFEQVPEAVRPYLIQRVLCEVSGKEKDIASTHLKSMEALFTKQVGRACCLPYKMKAVRCYEGVRIGICDGNLQEEQGLKDLEMICRVLARREVPEAFPQNPYTKWFDYDIIKSNVVLRSWAVGDYITIDDTGHTQQVKKYFTNEKIEKNERKNIPLVADGSHIMWIVGHRQNQKYQVTEQTARILEISISGGKENERDS